MRDSQCSADASHRPAQAPLQANRAQAIWKRLSTCPAPQSLRAAQQIMRGLLGGNRGAVHQFQRGELLGLRCSAAGVRAVFVCLHWLLQTPPNGDVWNPILCISAQRKNCGEGPEKVRRNYVNQPCNVCFRLGKLPMLCIACASESAVFAALISLPFARAQISAASSHQPLAPAFAVAASPFVAASEISLSMVGHS